jgi:hypothetical protein
VVDRKELWVLGLVQGGGEGRARFGFEIKHGGKFTSEDEERGFKVGKKHGG